MKKIAAPEQGVTVFTRSFTDTLTQFGVDGPVCHVGSKQRNIAPDVIARKRATGWSFLQNREIIGVDIEDGANVDLVADICSPSLFTDHPGLCSHFGFVFCSALLEHVVNPFAAAQNIQKLLRLGGHLLFTGPWVWGHHSYPDDYWRISISGVKVLFPEVEFMEWWYSGTLKDICIRIDDLTQERKVFVEQVVLRKAGHYITDRAMPYLNISAIGVRQ